MSAPVMDQVRGPIDLPVAEQNAGLSFLAIVRRRWPWVLVGLFVGIIGGLLAFTAARRVYQSTAQVLVVKNKNDLPMSGGDSRLSYMEDYMSTQATIMRSESVMTAAARKLPVDMRGLPQSIPERAKYMGTQLTVAREKDPNMPVANNNVLNVAYKSGDASDAKQILETVIEAYRDELKGVYDDATNRKIALLENAMKSNQAKIVALRDELQEYVKKVRGITQEDPSVIQSRYSATQASLNALQNEETEIKNNIALIEKAGDDKKARADMVLRMQPYLRGQAIQGIGNLNPNDPLMQARELEAQLAEMLKKYGPDHPIPQSIQARIKYLRDLYKELNPSDPEGKKDGLDQLLQILIQRRNTLEDLIKNTQSIAARDSNMLNQILPMKSRIDNLEKNIEQKEKQNDTFETEKVQTDLTRATGGFEARTLNKPSADEEPIAPKRAQNILLGAAIGLLFGIGLAALAELSDKGFRNPADIRARLGLPVIGHVPPIRTNLPPEEQLDIEPTVVSALRPKSVEAEAYRGVRTAIYFNAAGSTHQMIQVTSPSQGDGKSTLAANLAVSIAQSGKRTLLVDCDMRRPRVHRVFHLAEAGPGLAAVIAGNTPLSQAIQRSSIENLSLLPCGKKPANPAELLTSPNFSDLLDRLKSDYDYVILDTPPVLAVSDPSAVAPRADGVILVFRMTSKVRPLAERAREQLSQIGANIIGVVVNGAGRGDSSYGYGYGGEYTGYASDSAYMSNYSEDDDDEAPPKKG